ncbi:MAG: glycine cleavage system protein GcvH [Thermodesulfobacteriota bacterium]
MKDLSELAFPEDILYAPSHEWARSERELVRVGISDFAQDQLGDVVFVELPAVGAHFEAGGEFGTVESVKAVSPLYLPLAGEVTEVNAALADAPQLVNDEPYSGGWLVRVRPDESGGWQQGLLSAAAYRASLGAKEG